MEKTERFDLTKKEIVCRRYDLSTALKDETYEDFYLDVVEDPEEAGLYGGWIFHKEYSVKMLATELQLDMCGEYDDMMHIMLNQIVSGKAVEAYREYYMDEEET